MQQNHPSKMDFVIDIQNVRDADGDFFPKEVAIASLQKNIVGHWLIKAPCDFNELTESAQGANTYCATHLHGIHWFEGDTTLDSLRIHLREIAKSAVYVYVYGGEKAHYLQNMLGREIVNIEARQAPNYTQLNRMFPRTNVCTTHGLQLSSKVKYNCAFQKAIQLKEWFDRILLEQWRVDGLETSSECYLQSMLKYSRERKYCRIMFDGLPVGVNEVENDDDVEEEEEDYISFSEEHQTSKIKRRSGEEHTSEVECDEEPHA